MSIKILPEQVTNQIAAGEVIERPSSVVKELVENSIDAGASKVSIEIKNSNRYIRVSDNGSGMSSEDLDLAFKRHATSKITTIEDLNSLLTNGFRGEALASLSAVSKLTCISKRSEDEHASKLYIENSKNEKTLTGAANGTSITVDELFFNTPARLKFLKSSGKERNEIIDMVRALALSHPEIAFDLAIDAKRVLKTSKTQSVKNTMGEIFSLDVAKNLNEISFNSGDLEIKGFISSPHINRSDKRGIFTLLNNRAIRCNVMRSAVEAIARDMLPPGKHPMVVLYLNIPSEEVDVNVHPTKKEVKYRNANKIYAAIGDALLNALAPIFKDGGSLDRKLENISFSDESDQAGETGEEDNQDPEHEDAVEKDLSQVRGQNFLEREEDSEQDFNAPVDKLEAQNSRKFVSRLGSVDISLLDNTLAETNISSQGNKTNYEIVAKNEDKSRSIVLRGDFVGENWIKEKYMGFLGELAEEILESKLEKDELLKEHQIPAEELSPHAGRSRPNKKPSIKVLEEVWKRDNYTCVYCAAPVLHPKAAKEILEKAKADEVDGSKLYKKYLNKQGKEITINLIDEAVATYDHHLPASKYPLLNVDPDNLYASCQKCNKEKSNSLASKTWEPKRSNAWSTKVEIAGLNFKRPD